MRGSKALCFGIRLSVPVRQFLLWLCCSALRTAPNDLHALPPPLKRPAGAVTGCASEASFRSGSFLTLDCKSFFYARIQGALLRDPLVCACARECAVELLRGASYGSQRLSRFASSAQTASRSGDGLCFGGMRSVWEL